MPQKPRGHILQVVDSGGKRQMLLTGEMPVTIGRDPKNTLWDLSDDKLSPFHCVIERREDHFYIRDLNSVTGMIVNEQEVLERRLKPGDQIVVGRMKLRYDVREVDPSRIRAALKRRKAESEATRTEPIALEPDTGGIEPGLRRSPKMPPPGAKAAELQPARRTGAPQAFRSETDEDPRVVAAAKEQARSLAKLVTSLPDQTFQEIDVNLFDARGNPVPVPQISGVKAAVKHGAEAVLFLRALLLLCFRTRATDLHMEPKGDEFSVRVRVDGMMTSVFQMHNAIGQRVQRVVKVLCDIDISESRSVQEGHFSVVVPQRRVDYRVSFTPAMHGQKLVIRVLDVASSPSHMRDLGLPQWMATDLGRVIHQDSGMILVCGPTGSGKTSTLYALLREIDRSTRNVITIEDPVEYQIDNVTQIPVNDAQGNSFSNLLRSVLRQDPDVLLVGEVRDAETAKIAMQAAITGHLVFSTVHARDTFGAIYRVLDLGVERFLVAGSLHLILSQRLLRTLCPYCKRASIPTASQMRLFDRVGVRQVTEVCEPVGCERCLETGYIGRRAIFEMLTANAELRDAILTSPQTHDLRKALRSTMFTSLRESAFSLAVQGLTSFDEIERVVGVD